MKMIIDNVEDSSKPSLLFIHGLGLDNDTWGPLMPLLSSEYNIICFTLPGHGGSSEQPFYTWEHLCGMLLSLLDSKNILKAHLVGHGFGANLSVKLALQSPERVESLSLLSLPGFIPREYLLRAVEERAKLLTSTDPLTLLQHLLPTLTAYPERAELRSLVATAFRKVSGSSYIELMRLFAQDNVIEEVSRVTQPTLMLSGELDTVYTPALSAVTSSYIRSCRFLIVPGASNLIFLDQPEWTALWLKQHLSSVAGRSQIESNAVTAASEQRSTSSLHKVIELGNHLLHKERELSVKVLHTFQISVNGSEITEGWNKRFAKQLLIYLLLFPYATRQQIYDDLWPDRDLRKAQNYLRVCLNHLKSLLEPYSNGFEFLRIDREHISLQGTISCDLLDLLCELNGAMEERDPAKKEALIYTLWGKLPEHILSGYCDDWILGTRVKIEAQLAELSHWLMENSEGKRHLSSIAASLQWRYPYEDEEAVGK